MSSSGRLGTWPTMRRRCSSEATGSGGRGDRGLGGRDRPPHPHRQSGAALEPPSTHGRRLPAHGVDVRARVGQRDLCGTFGIGHDRHIARGRRRHPLGLRLSGAPWVASAARGRREPARSSRDVDLRSILRQLLLSARALEDSVGLNWTALGLLVAIGGLAVFLLWPYYNLVPLRPRGPPRPLRRCPRPGADHEMHRELALQIKADWVRNGRIVRRLRGGNAGGADPAAGRDRGLALVDRLERRRNCDDRRARNRVHAARSACRTVADCGLDAPNSRAAGRED